LKLKDYLQALHPTIFASVPKLYNKFFEAMKITHKKNWVGLRQFWLKKQLL